MAFKDIIVALRANLSRAIRQSRRVSFTCWLVISVKKRNMEKKQLDRERAVDEG